MARSRAVLLLLLLSAVLTALVAAASATSSEESSRPTILTPVADTPLGSFDGADGPVADDAMEDEEAAPVGAPIGTTMTEPKPELSNAPPGATDGDDADTSGASGASILSWGPAAAVAAAVAAAGVFAF